MITTILCVIGALTCLVAIILGALYLFAYLAVKYGG